MTSKNSTIPTEEKVNSSEVSSTTSKTRQLSSKPVPNESERDKYSLSITDTLYSLFDKAIQAEYSSLPEAAVVITASKMADYQCNSAMAISQVFKSKTQIFI